MRVVEARDHGPAGEVEDARLRADEARDVGVASDRDDAAAAHGHGLGARPPGVDRVHDAAAEHEVSRGSAAAAAAAQRMEEAAASAAEARVIERLLFGRDGQYILRP